MVMALAGNKSDLLDSRKVAVEASTLIPVSLSLGCYLFELGWLSYTKITFFFVSEDHL